MKRQTDRETDRQRGRYIYIYIYRFTEYERCEMHICTYMWREKKKIKREIRKEREGTESCSIHVPTEKIQITLISSHP